MIGRKFERLTVIEQDFSKPTGRGHSRHWKCLCDCGNITSVATGDLMSGNTKSCGCYRRDNSRVINTKHGQSKTRLYNVWNTMKSRCNNPKSEKYPMYGGRGIKVCDEWLHDYMAFYDWSMANGYKDGLTIDRIDVGGNYEPSNCRWVTTEIQANNTRTNHRVEFNGEVHTIAEWSRITNISKPALYHRVSRGWSIEKMLTTPMRLPKEG